MDHSILNDVKIFCGITPEYEHFDTDIINDINTAIAILRQLGVGPKTGFMIEDASSTWGDLLGDDIRLIFVKTYVKAKVKIEFDPPANSTLLQALKDTVAEMEFRITSVTDYEPEEE